MHDDVDASLDAAAAALEARLTAVPGSLAFADLAALYLRRGRLAEAIATARAGLRQYPAFLAARVTLGRALAANGDTSAARTEFATVLGVVPDHAGARRGLDALTAAPAQNDRRRALEALLKGIDAVRTHRYS